MHVLGSLVLMTVIVCSQAFVALRNEPNIRARGLEKRYYSNSVCSTAPELYDYGGTVLTGNVNFYTVYYGTFSTWPGAMTGTQNFMTAIGSSSYWAQLKQYGVVGKWSNSGKSFHDTSRTSGTLTQAEIESWLPIYVRRGNLPADKNAHMVFIISKSFTVEATGQVSCVDFCSLHGSYVDRTNFGTAVSISYTLLPECVNPECDMGLGSTNNYMNWWQALLSHEFAEAATDPFVTSGNVGWYSPYGNCTAGGEIADICDGEGHLVTWSGAQYGVQALWMNDASTCSV
jgi:hypothetical protein